MAEKKYSILLSATNETRAAFAQANRDVEGLTGGLFSLQAILGTVSVVGIAAMIKSSIDAADKLNDLNKSTGISVTQLAGLKLASQQSGTDLDAVAKSINKLSINMGLNAEKYAALGINSTDKLEAYKQFADVFNRIGDVHERDAFAAAALGKSWQDLAPLLSEGGAAIGQMVDKGAQLSGMTDDMATRADALTDRMAELKMAGEGIATRFTIALLPSLEGVSGALIDVVTDADSMNTAAGVLTGVVNTLASAGFGAAHVFSQFGTAIGGAAAAAMAAISGDFSGAKKILEMNNEDLAKSEEKFAERIKKIWETPAAAPLQKKAARPAGDSPDVSGIIGTDAADKAAAAAAAKAAAAEKADEALIGRQQEKFMRMREQADEFDASDTERENIRFEAKMRALENEKQVLQDKHLYDLESEALYLAAKEAMNAEHTEKLRVAALDSDKRIVDGKVRYQKISLDSMGAFFGMAKGLMNSHSRAAFEIGKAAAISETLINTYAAATGAYKAMASIPFVGPALGVVAAAAAIASGMAQVSAIQSTSFGGSGAGGGSYGGANSSNGGGAATPNYPVSPPPSAAQQAQPIQISIYNTGTFVDAQAFVDNTIIPQIRDQISNSDVLLINPRSRQAQVLGVA